MEWLDAAVAQARHVVSAAWMVFGASFVLGTATRLPPVGMELDVQCVLCQSLLSPAPSSICAGQKLCTQLQGREACEVILGASTALVCGAIHDCLQQLGRQAHAVIDSGSLDSCCMCCAYVLPSCRCVMLPWCLLACLPLPNACGFHCLVCHVFVFVYFMFV
jgi:hypothetical protein